MKVKWSDLFKDLKGVILKHFRPEKPEAMCPEARLIQMINLVKNQQKSVNGLRDGLLPLVDMMKNDEVLSELHRLEAMAPKESIEPVASSDKDEDVMFR
jgi:hypothetical protein